MEELKQLIESLGLQLSEQTDQLAAQAEEMRKMRAELNGVLAAQRQCNHMLAAIQQAWADLHSEGRIRRSPSDMLRAVTDEGG